MSNFDPVLSQGASARAERVNSSFGVKFQCTSHRESDIYIALVKAKLYLRIYGGTCLCRLHPLLSRQILISVY